MNANILDILSRRPVLADGAMGTLLLERGAEPGSCLDHLNLAAPERVLAVHRAYLAAGAEVIETNTFGANRRKLERHGLAALAGEINARGVALARQAADEAAPGRPGERATVWVAGAMGPLGRHQGEEPGPEEIAAVYTEQSLSLARAGADLLVLETFPDLALLLAALDAVTAATDLPVSAQMVFTAQGRSLDGRSPAECFRLLRAHGADIVGLNCGVGPKGARDILARSAAESGGGPDAPLAVFPNAGFPERLDDRLIYASSPDYFAGMVAACVAHGARLLGGCCGSGPAHVAALRQALDALEHPEHARAAGPGASLDASPPASPTSSPLPDQAVPILTPQPLGTTCPAPTGKLPGPAAPALEFPASTPLPQAAPPSPAPGGPTLADKVRHPRAGHPLILVELDPPKHLDTGPVLEGAEALAAAGVDAITVAENPLAVPRLSNIALACLIKARTGAETVVHLTGRDRNLIGMQSVIMGLSALGLSNVLAVTGDPPPAGGEERLTGVFDVRSSELLGLLQGFNEGRNASGEDMKSGAGLFVGAAFNPNTANIRMQVGRMERKIALGAEYFLTQPVYSRDKVDEVLAATAGIRTTIFLGIMPLASHRNAEFLHNEFPGINIPDGVRERMRQAGDRGAAEGLEIAWELMEYALPRFAGIYIMPPFNRYKTALELLRRARG